MRFRLIAAVCGAAIASRLSNRLPRAIIRTVIAFPIAALLGCGTLIDRGIFGDFENTLNTTSHGYQVIDDPTGQATTTRVERFEVRAGDCSWDRWGWSDCANDRERSELAQLNRRFTHGEYWYGWSLYIPHDFPIIWPVKTSLGQFHQQNSHPIWMIQLMPGGMYLDRQTSRGTVRLFPLLREEELRGRWHRFEVHARWSHQRDGFLNVWVNGELKVHYAGPTFFGENVYFKYGVYRTFVSRSNITPVPTQIALFANVRAARTREGLQSRE